MMRFAIVAIVATVTTVLSLSSVANAQTESEDEANDPEEEGEGETVYIVPVKDSVVPGASQAVDAEALERFEHDDINRILAEFSGVEFREEDGYGLRPNIGMRGSGSERSARIALMEDGILIAPAPYSAPAAYYFPLVTKMSRVEVLKGPASVRYGPNTVAGALNLVTRPVPREREGEIDIAVGNDLYGKLHGVYGESSDHVGLLIEGLKLRTDGFKELDGGGDTGFDKNDIALKLRVNSDTRASTYNEAVLRFGYSDETSNETYTGLTDDDFAESPNRRYRGTALDRMDWKHRQVQLVHKLEVGGDFAVTTQLYHHDFDRSWRKLNGFAGTDIADVLANPSNGNNALLYAILTGAADSTSSAESLIVGTNDRAFTSQGVQSAARLSRAWLGLEHRATGGVRLHQDSASRLHTEERFFMIGGSLVAENNNIVTTRDTIGSSNALAVFAQDEANLGRLTVTVGNRIELISIDHTDSADPSMNADRNYAVMIPGGGVFYKLLPQFGLLSGIHRGFLPVAPGQDQDVDPEKSINYEAGVRFGGGLRGIDIEGEAIGFFNDYSNLKGSCTFSTGCDESQVGDEFNGGSVHTLGFESSTSALVPFGSFKLPLRASYTFNRSRFQSAFRSANPQWGDVKVGDEVPYLPAHQVSLGAGIGGQGVRSRHRWEVSGSARYSSAMRDSAGQGPMDERATDSQSVIDVAASYDFKEQGRVYLTVSNVLDQAHVVSRRPFGARPGRPRFVILGYKLRL